MCEWILKVVTTHARDRMKIGTIVKLVIGVLILLLLFLLSDSLGNSPNAISIEVDSPVREVSPVKF